jgi:NAD(P)-dependent dehydrogenase (short-subunit alcohol dehydrogenase family)
MSEVTRTLHRTNYPAIDAASPEQSQSGWRVLITGSSGGIGLAVAKAYVTAGADVVVVTSRKAEKAKRVANELQAVGKDLTKVLGYRWEQKEDASINALWDDIQRQHIQIDTLVLCTTESVPGVELCL